MKDNKKKHQEVACTLARHKTGSKCMTRSRGHGVKVCEKCGRKTHMYIGPKQCFCYSSHKDEY